MAQYEVTFVKEKKSLLVEDGTTLLNAQRLAGLRPDAPCGGQGTCGKCKLTIVKNGSRKIVKACQTLVREDMQVETMDELGKVAILTQGRNENCILDSVLRSGMIQIPKLKLGQALSQWERLQQALGKTFGKTVENIQPDLALSSELYEKLRKSDTWYAVIGSDKILSLTETQVPVYGAAIDIGTTTVVGYLVNPETGETLATASRMNPQTQYGADVIMRCNYAIENGAAPLRDGIRSCLQDILQELAERAAITVRDIYAISVVGNTCMHHLLLGISPNSLAHAPYNPAVRQGLILDARDQGIYIHENGQMILLPNIAGFVGADTMGCMLCTRPDLDSDISLMIDIGTNGEMVMGSRNGLVTCSTAAGPAFEGAKIECGMRGTAGAIDHVYRKNGKIVYSTIGSEKPIGLCGSGLIDLTAVLLDSGIIDESGFMDVEDSRYILVPAEESGNGNPVYLSQRDVREVQLAKAAIAAGIILLRRELNIQEEDIKKVYIAGAFGNYMDASSACRIGLIPQSLKNRIQPIGNAAGEGAKIAILNRQALRDSETLARQTAFVELAASADFQDCFVDELEFNNNPGN